MFKKKEKSIQEDTEKNILTNHTADGKDKKPKKIKKERQPIDWQVTFKNKRNIGIFIMLLTVFCVFLVNPAIEYFQSKDEIIIYLAQEDIEKGKEITNEMIRKVTTSQSAIVNQLAFDTSPVGKFSKSAIFKDEAISEAKLSNNMPFRDEYLYSIPKGKKAISISLANLASGLSAKVKADDIVTIYAFIDDERESDTFIASQPKELEYVKVLSVSDSEGAEIVSTGTPTVQIPATVTLLVSDEQAKALVGLEKLAAVHLGIANRGSKEKAEELLELQDKYLESIKINTPTEPVEQDTEVIE